MTSSIGPLLIVLLYQISLLFSSSDVFSHCLPYGECYQECGFTIQDSACDTLPSIPPDLREFIWVWRTSHKNEKFTPFTYKWYNEPIKSVVNKTTVRVNSSIRYQTIKGFGAAFTDAVVHNLNAMQHIATTQHQNDELIADVLYSYFSWNDSYAEEVGTGGSGYLYGRIPIASTDFSPYSYTYSPIKDDFELKHFKLTQQDLGNKSNSNMTMGRIAIIQLAQRLISQTNTDHDIHLFATPWTAPPWMKVEANIDEDPNGYFGGHLNPNRTFWKTYAQYFVRYISEYKKQGDLHIEAVTPQNEPHSPSPWESMRWSDTELMEFIADYLGPALKAYNKSIGIWVHDGQKIEIPEDVIPYFMNSNVSQFVDAVAFHWYLSVPPTPGCPKELCNGSFSEIEGMYEFLQSGKGENKEDVFMINTEACSGFNIIQSPPKRGVVLGVWYRGMQYAEDMIGDIIHGVSGWIDWNFILDINGGPNHADNQCDAPIVVDLEKQKYYKQPMYYFMAHITRYVLRDSVRIGITNDDGFAGDGTNGLWYTAVIDDKTMNNTVIVMMNTNRNTSIEVYIHDERKGFTFLSLPPHSIQTMVYSN